MYMRLCVFEPACVEKPLPPENLLKDTDGVLVASPPFEGAGRSNTQPFSDLSGAVANCVCFLLTRASLDDVIAFEGSRS